MHSVEVDPSPKEVLLGVGRLIVEGRLPGIAARGFGEGPHASNPFQTNTKLHTCTSHNSLCSRDKNLRRHVSLLWENCVPLCIEVILCSTCPCGKEKSTSAEISQLADTSYHILESWTISYQRHGRDCVTRPPPGTVNSLLQVVRSYLHFSQLGSWLSLSKGERPSNVLYRVTMPAEAFGSKFSVPPLEHEFPSAHIKNYRIKVMVCSTPRAETIPQVFCTNVKCPEGRKQGCGLIIEPRRNLARQPKRSNNPACGGERILGDEAPSRCQISGKHCCSEEEDEDDVRPRAKSPLQSEHISRRDLFLKSLAHQKRGQGKIVEDSPLVSTDDEESDSKPAPRPIPTQSEKIKFRRSLQSAASMVFHRATGLPLTSSPAPSLRRGQDHFDFDPACISGTGKKSHYHPPPRSSETSQLLGSFEESVLHGRIEPVSTVEGFSAEIGASGSFCPKHIHLPVTVFFYTFCDNDKVSTPYLAHLNLGPKGYAVPRVGTLQVTLFNPQSTVIKMFVVMYDCSDMPRNSTTFLRQRILCMPCGASDRDKESQKWLRYLIHLRLTSGRSGRIYLCNDVRIIVFRKSSEDTGIGHSVTPHEVRSFTNFPTEPKYSPRSKMASAR